MKTKLLLILSGTFIFVTSQAQDQDFDKHVNLIKEKITCCATSFIGAEGLKASGIEISKDGVTQIFYEGKEGPLVFHLSQLFKDNNSATGISQETSSPLLLLHFSAEKTHAISFATPQDANAVSVAFQELVKQLPKEVSPDLNFQRTVDAINIRLAKWSDTQTQIYALPDGDFIIFNNKKQSFRFNLFNLAKPFYRPDRIDAFGIEPVSCTINNVAPATWINFYTREKQVAFFKLKCMPDAELQIIYQFLKHLKTLCPAPSPAIFRPAGATYYLQHHQPLQTGHEALSNSIRASDKKDVGDTTFIIANRGEGWLDKDSIPVGEWRFFAKDEHGKEYLFKTGTYMRSTSASFSIRDEDAELLKTCRTSTNSLKEQQASSIPYVKGYTWIYYHPNGRIWKKVNFLTTEIPILLEAPAEIDDSGNTEVKSCVVRLKTDLDEWISKEVTEYDREGKLFKKVLYNTSGDVYRKILYGKDETVLKEETARPYERILSPYHF